MSSKNKKSVKFILTPRPQKDPLAADFEAPQHVLVPKGGADIDKIRAKLPDFDSTLFQSRDETKVGMLERAHKADGVTFDSDLLRAMSKEFDYDNPNNLLDDDFMDQAGGLIEDEGEMLDGEMTDLTKQLFEDEPEIIDFNHKGVEEDDRDDDGDSDNYDLDEVAAGAGENSETFQGSRLILFKNKLKKKALDEVRAGHDQGDIESHDGSRTVFTNYSMTSSVMRRSKGLQEMDEHFERLYEKEYADDTEIGALDLNEVKGDETLTNMDQIKQLKKEVKIARHKDHGDAYVPEVTTDHYKTAIIGDDPIPEEESSDEDDKREKRLDCESILSYNSNLYNHPKLIVEPRKRNTSRNSTNQMDVDDYDERSRSGRSQSIASTRATIVAKLSTRPPNETAEERKARKKALKSFRQERRQERKQNKQIFKTEQAKLVKQQRTNMTALKLS